MPAKSSPPSDGGTERPRANYANPGMRVSDAERHEVADRLSRHYADGRLDQEEFDKRMSQAMGATTQADLNGLFADLPGGDEPAGRTRASQPDTASGASQASGPHPADRRPRKPVQRLLALAILIVAVAAVGHAVTHLFFPVVVIGVAVVLWLRLGPSRRRP
jgi:Flp pilus assembly protein TadB